MRPLEFNHRKQNLLESLNIELDDVMSLQGMSIHEICKELFENENQKLMRALAYSIYHQYTELGRVIVLIGFLLELNSEISPSKKASKQIEYIERKLIDLLHNSKPEYRPSKPAENMFGLTLAFFQAEAIELAKSIVEKIQRHMTDKEQQPADAKSSTTLPPFQIDKSILN